jgi:hypothetical protein
MIDPTDDELRAFIEESLPPQQLNELLRRLPADPGLQRRLEAIRAESPVPGDLGAIWRFYRLSCPDRGEWGSYLLGVLEPGLADYLRFHLEEVGCQYCAANVEDLKASLQAQRSASEAQAIERRRTRYYQSGAGILGSADDDDRPRPAANG